MRGSAGAPGLLLRPAAAMPEHFQPDPPVAIGLLGGVASGKSAVARIFAEHGLLVLDADVEARAVTSLPDVLATLAHRFGPGVLRPDGSLDREELGRIVFADAQAREDLEALTHPRIRAALLQQLDAALERGQSVLLDVPLLLEGGLIGRCDVNVFVEASAATRRARARSRGWDASEVERREASQASLDVKRARCRYSIDNNLPLQDVRGQVASILADLQQQP